MIITEDKVLLNLNFNNSEYKNLTLTGIENLLKSYKFNLKENLKPKESINISNSYIYFSDDEQCNRFFVKYIKLLLVNGFYS